MPTIKEHVMLIISNDVLIVVMTNIRVGFRTRHENRMAIVFIIEHVRVSLYDIMMSVVVFITRLKIIIVAIFMICTINFVLIILGLLSGT